MINNLKAVCCFNKTDKDNLYKEAIEFKTNDNLDNCRLAPCQYYTLFPEIAETISNMPWGKKPVQFFMEVLKSTDKINIIQIINVDGEWRRRQFSNSLTTWWGEWINIEKIINDVLNNENVKKFLTENWDRYMIIDKITFKRKWRGNKVTIDEIVKQIKTGTAQIYSNKII